MKALIEVSVRRRLDGVEDEFGNPVESWSDPEAVKVFSVGPAYSRESEQLVVTGRVIGSPSDYGLKSRDVLLIDGSEWLVEGDVLNSNLGPFGYQPGWVINVRRSEQ